LLQEETYEEFDLIDSVKQKSPAAINTLYDKYAPALYTVVLQIVRDENIANSVLQTAFIGIIDKIETYDPRDQRLCIWMFKIARSAAIDVIRSGGKPDALVHHTDKKDEKVADLKLDNYGLKKLITKLQDEQKILLDLCYYKGYSKEEIAEALSIPAETVDKKLRMAVSELRTALL
jgi:RNA polymerase sigma-70 factor (ECF subfamily)